MHWRHSDFQIRHFIAGKAHTPDEAYRLVKQELENRRLALGDANATKLRTEALWKRAQRVASESGEGSPERLEAEATKLEILNHQDQNEACLEACSHEIEILSGLLAELLPRCKYAGHMPDSQAFQAAQEEEWCLELIHRARVMLSSSGFIPWDQLETMALHPAWATKIQPRIHAIRSQLGLGESPENLLGRVSMIPTLSGGSNGHAPRP